MGVQKKIKEYKGCIKTLKIKLDEGAIAPTRGHDTDVGYDLYTPESFVVNPHSAVIVDTGVHIQLFDNVAGIIKSRSGMHKRGLQTEGVIDPGYTGQIKVRITNHSDSIQICEAGDRIAQMLLVPVICPEFEVVESLDETERGDGGFGSTGR